MGTAKTRVFLLLCSVVIATAMKRVLPSNVQVSPFRVQDVTNSAVIRPRRQENACWQKSTDVFFKCVIDKKATYEQAKSNCTALGGRLAAAALRDPNAVSYIKTECLVLGSSNRFLWIGFNDIATEGSFIWSDGGSMDNATTAWAPTMPDDAGGAEDCVHIREPAADGRLLLNDISCDKIFSYVCEVPISGDSC